MSYQSLYSGNDVDNAIQVIEEKAITINNNGISNIKPKLIPLTVLLVVFFLDFKLIFANLL